MFDWFWSMAALHCYSASIWLLNRSSKSSPYLGLSTKNQYDISASLNINNQSYATVSTISSNQFGTAPEFLAWLLYELCELCLFVENIGLNLFQLFGIFTFQTFWNIFLQGNIFWLGVWQLALVLVLWPFFVVSKWADIKNQDTPVTFSYLQKKGPQNLSQMVN